MPFPVLPKPTHLGWELVSSYNHLKNLKKMKILERWLRAQQGGKKQEKVVGGVETLWRKRGNEGQRRRVDSESLTARPQRPTRRSPNRRRERKSRDPERSGSRLPLAPQNSPESRNE